MDARLTLEEIELFAQVDRAHLGRQIRAVRLSLGMTQRQVATDAFAVSYLSRIESGTRKPSVDALRHIADRLGVSATVLMSPARRGRSATAADAVAAATSAWLEFPFDREAFGAMCRAVELWKTTTADDARSF